MWQLLQLDFHTEAIKQKPVSINSKRYRLLMQISKLLHHNLYRVITLLIMISPIMSMIYNILVYKGIFIVVNNITEPTSIYWWVHNESLTAVGILFAHITDNLILLLTKSLTTCRILFALFLFQEQIEIKNVCNLLQLW